MSTSPRRSGTLAIVRTPTPGGMRTQRSGAITPRRAACARSKREVCVGNRSVTWRAISAPVAVMPMKIGPVQSRIARARLLAERGVRLVADHDRVGARDLARVAHEPLVGLDRHGAVDRVLALQQRPADALGVAAVAQLAVELVDEVAPVGEDQHAAGLRGLDEAERRDRLARAGRVLEPEALGRVGVLGLLAERLLPSSSSTQSRGSSSDLGLARRALVLGSSSSASSSSVVLLVLVLVLLVGRGALDRAELVVLLVLVVLVLVLLVLVGSSLASSCLGVAPRRRAVGRDVLVGAEDVRGGEQLGRRRGGARRWRRVPLRCASASSAVSVPESASTWCAESTVPSASLGSSSESSRSSPSSSENSRRQAVEGCLALGSSSSSASARSSARRRGVPGRERDGGVLALVQEALAHELLRAR